jgi:hypothetical protein
LPIAACVQIQNGDMASTIVRIAAVDRLETIVAAVAARAEEAAQRLDELTRRLDGPAPGTADPVDPVRVAAIELAVAGYDRAQAESRLRQRFPGADLAPVLADVY